jgi:hypothetical protein
MTTIKSRHWRRRQTVIHVVLAAGVLIVSGLLIHRETRILQGYELNASAEKAINTHAGSAAVLDDVG